MALTKRHISLKFELGEGAFGAEGSNTFEVSGIRCSATIEQNGGIDMTWLALRAFGLPLEVMNRLTLLGKPLAANRHNTITVSAGDDESGLAVVFIGTISEAWVDARSAPAVTFVVSAFSGLVDAIKPVPPVSYKGTVDAALVVSGIARQAGYEFENSGVDVQIADPYLSGTTLQQLQKIARAGAFNCVLEDDGTAKRIAIWPQDGSRNGEELLFSPDAGMVGYPMRTENGITLQTLFNPSLRIGRNLRVKSSLTPANGRWTIFRVSHDIEAETPGGKWFSEVECNILGQELSVG